MDGPKKLPEGVSARSNPLEAAQLEVLEAASVAAAGGRQDARSRRPVVPLGRLGGVHAAAGRGLRAGAGTCTRVVGMRPVPLECPLHQLLHARVILPACRHIHSAMIQNQCQDAPTTKSRSSAADEPGQLRHRSG